MLTAHDLQDHLGIRLTKPSGNARSLYRISLDAVAAVLGDDPIEAFAAWLDYGMEGREEGVHIHLLTARGVITLNCDFSFDGYPAARLVPWSRITELHVIASPNQGVTNVWIETETGKVEFAGALQHSFPAIIDAVKGNLK